MVCSDSVGMVRWAVAGNCRPDPVLLVTVPDLFYFLIACFMSCFASADRLPVSLVKSSYSSASVLRLILMEIFRTFSVSHLSLLGWSAMIFYPLSAARLPLPCDHIIAWEFPYVKNFFYFFSKIFLGHIFTPFSRACVHYKRLA